MVTWFRRLEALSVRVRALHPILVLLFVLLLSPSVSAEEVDFVTLEYALNSDSSLLQFFAAGVNVFGSRWQYDTSIDQVTGIQGWSNAQWNKLDEGDRLLLFSVLDALLGAQTRIEDIEANSISVPDLDSWTNLIHSARVISSASSLNGQTVPDLVAILSQNQQALYTLLNSNVVATTQSFHSFTGGRDYEAKGGSLTEILRYSANSSADLGRMFYNQIGSGSVSNFYKTFNSDSRNLSALYSSQGKDLSLISALSLISENQLLSDRALRYFLTTYQADGDMLYSDGSFHDTDTFTLTDVARYGFTGLASIISGVGQGTDSSSPAVIKFNVVDPDDPLAVFDEQQDYTNLFDFFSWLAADLNKNLTKLQFVLANDEDIQMKQDEKPNQEAAVDGFFGNGDGAVKPTDISDAASIAGDVKSTFSGAGSAGDAFTVLNSGDTYSFFSQAVSDDLNSDPLVSPQSMDDSWMDNFVEDEEGFLSLKPSSMFDVSLYLEELMK